MSQYVSDELFHFVGRHEQTVDKQFQLLVKILQSGTLLSSSVNGSQGQIDPDGRLLSGELNLVPALCFCDIPRPLLDLHTRKYSQFGISFTKRFLTQRGAKPVIYIPLKSRPTTGKGTRGHSVPHSLRRLLNALRGLRKVKMEPNWAYVDGNTRRLAGEAANLQGFLTSELYYFIKVFDEDLPQDHPKNYYMEREWRLVNSSSRSRLEFSVKDVHAVMAPQHFRSAILKQFPLLADRLICPRR